MADRPEPRARPVGLFLVATELFGSGNSSSPSNTPEPFHGPRFPVMTIRDNVDAVHRLLTEELKIAPPPCAESDFPCWARSRRIPVGGKLSRLLQSRRGNIGNCQVLSARRRPARRTDRRAHRRSRLSEQHSVFSAKNGLAAFGMVWAGWLYSQEWWRKELKEPSREPRWNRS